MKKMVKRALIVLFVIYGIILLFFFYHIFQVNQFNNQERTVTSDTVSMDVTTDIHPRGLATDTWEKNDAFPDIILNAKIYECTVINNSQCLLSDWVLRININENCYLNNAWNGTVEVHQFDDGGENVDTINLRNYDIDSIKVDYSLAGQDLLIPLKAGDFIIYYPAGGSLGEVPLKSTEEFSGEANIGIIFYSLSGEVNLSDFVMTYYLQMSYFNGLVGKVFLVLIPFWAVVIILVALVGFIDIKYESTVLFQSNVIDDLFLLCSTVADEKDFYHKNHSQNVANIAKKIAEHMGMEKSDCDIVYYGSLLHNIGNYAVPEKILSKTTRLSPEEEKVAITHTVRGSNILKQLQSMPMAAPAALYHHEKYDGTGYPAGKKGDEIPLIARIIAVADAYDDMCHDRVDRKRLSLDEIKEEFCRESGKSFDPFIVEVFLEIIDELDK